MSLVTGVALLVGDDAATIAAAASSSSDGASVDNGGGGTSTASGGGAASATDGEGTSATSNATALAPAATLSPVVVAAASLLDAVLQAVPSADAELGQESAELISNMLGDLGSFQEVVATKDINTAAPDASTVAAAEETANKLRSATESLADKVLLGLEDALMAGGGGGWLANATQEVALRSANLNMTVQARPPTALVGAPAC